MHLSTLNDALYEELRDLYSAERQLTEALPRMAASATDAVLKAVFEQHLADTEVHVNRLEQAFDALGRKAQAHTCDAMKGLLKEGRELMQEDADPAVMDALLIAAAQKVEHYEIASYGTVCTWAALLGQDEVKMLLGQTLQEEKTADETLTTLAERSLNAQAA